MAEFQVTEFHDSMGLDIRDPEDGATVGTEEQRELRINLIEEEAQEFREACEAGDLIEMADALADLLYVTYGAAITFGIPLDAVVAEVHRSNMTKLWTSEDLMTLPPLGDGRYYVDEDLEGHIMQPGAERHTVVYRSRDGKVMKPPSYEAPDILQVLMRRGHQKGTVPVTSALDRHEAT